MKIGKIELAGRNLVIAISAVAAVIAIVVYAVFYVPILKDIGAKGSECRMCEGRLADARELVASSGKTLDSRVLMSEDRISLAMDELTKYGKAMGVNFISITPKNIADEKGAEYRILPVEIEIKAADEKFSEFLGALENQKKTVVKVESFDIVPEETDPSRVNAKLTIDLYISKREYEE
jgi:hypothetical protein